MTLPLRLGMSLCASVLVLGGVVGAARCLGVAVGLDDLGRIRHESERREALTRRNRHLIERNTGKHRITEEVFARRLSLLQAAEAFRRLEVATAEEAPPSAARCDDLSEEALCRNVLTWVRANLSAHPGQAAVLRDLEAEFAVRFRHAPDEVTHDNASLHLPSGVAPEERIRSESGPCG